MRAHQVASLAALALTIAAFVPQEAKRSGEAHPCWCCGEKTDEPQVMTTLGPIRVCRKCGGRS